MKKLLTEGVVGGTIGLGVLAAGVAIAGLEEAPCVRELDTHGVGADGLCRRLAHAYQ